MKLHEPSIILIRPQLPENIGMVARAMQNCGFSKLILVSPREKWPNNLAIKSAAKAENIIKNAKVFKNTTQAFSNFHYIIATSSRRRYLNKYHEKKFSNLFSKIPIKKKVAILFGPENSGLSNEDLILSDCIFSIPTSNNNTSLNLSHSVLLMMYKWQEFFYKFKIDNIKKSKLAKKDEFNIFMNYLKKELKDSNFLHPAEKSESMFNNIQTLFLRANLSRSELQTLWGMFKKLKKTNQ